MTTPEMTPLIRGTLSVVRERVEDANEVGQPLALIGDLNSLTRLSRVTITSLFPGMLSLHVPLQPRDEMRIARSLHDATLSLTQDPSLLVHWINDEMVPLFTERTNDIAQRWLNEEEEKEAMGPYERVLSYVRLYNPRSPQEEQIIALQNFLDLNNDMRSLGSSLKRERKALLEKFKR